MFERRLLCNACFVGSSMGGEEEEEEEEERLI